MRTVISHFFNEEYLLPWWLEHHVKLFDHGILIDHGSTDRSVEICRALAPNWRLVRTRLMNFDAYLTDFEVMQFEQSMPGWKMALNVTEFLLPTCSLDELELRLTQAGRGGCAATGLLAIDHDPGVEPDQALPLPLQKCFAIDDNAVTDPALRASLEIGAFPHRNRFYHRHSVGMYHPGRHRSFHPDAQVRLTDLFVLHMAYAPWNERAVARKLQIAQKLPPADVQRGWGYQHLRGREALDAHHALLRSHAIDLRAHPGAAAALARLKA